MGFGLMGFGLIFWVLLVAGVVWAVKYVAGQNRRSHGNADGKGSQRPLEILEERYARGEMTRQEFEERRSVLHEG